ncbi:MAG: hypothetical protein LBN31_07620 [Hungatella sp.]|jgi:hypothetical protein|nr:hypothetical protein [Hungatella sp.]
MENKEAVEILQKHIDTYQYQLSDGGWKQMVSMGIARPTIQEKLSFQKDARKQIQAYEMAIAALKRKDQ